MRNTIDRQTLETELTKFTRRLADRSELLRDAVSDTSKWDDYDITLFYIKTRKISNYIGLAIISWYIPEEIGISLRLTLESKWPAEHYIEKDLLLQNKDLMIIYLIETNLWHTRDFFGNILTKELQDLYNKIYFVKRRKKVIYPQFHRGYRDKGTLRPLHQPEVRQVTKVRTVQEVEDQRKISEDTLEFIKGMLY